VIKRFSGLELKDMVELVLANFVNINSEILVISANLSLLAGSGISGIIHKAAGPQLEAAAKPFAPLTPGQAIITPRI